MIVFHLLTYLILQASATVLFDGDFGYYESDSALDKWSWSNQVGPYQSYIYGTGNKFSNYVDVNTAYCNSNFNSKCKKGAAFMIDGTSRWNGQVMLRTEVIPSSQPSASRRRFYRFSMQVINLNPAYEHQLVFFENHMCEIKFGTPSGQSSSSIKTHLQFWVSGSPRWTIAANSDWHNFAFEIDYTSNKVSLWWSINGNPLVNVLSPVSMQTSASDFHVGILRLTLNNAQDSTATTVHYSNILIEDTLSSLPTSGVITSPSTQPPTKVPTGSLTPNPTSRPPSITPTSRPPSTTPTSPPPSITPTQSNSYSVLFDGDFGYYFSNSQMDQWSWSNQVGPFQSYIFGSESRISNYVDLSYSYCNVKFNPACRKGASFMIDGSSRWNGQTMLRTEVIPSNQPPASGRKVYTFSIRIVNLNPSYEHQLVFFENHMCEIKYGTPSGQSSSAIKDHLQFWVSGSPRWTINAGSSEWHNFAFDINYNSQQVTLWWSSDGTRLSTVTNPISMSSTTLSDFHLGILRLQLNGIQDPSSTRVYYSNMMITSSMPPLGSSLTQSPQVTITPTPSSTVAPSTRSPTNSSTQPPPGMCGSTSWSQCGGKEYAGPTCCPSGDRCTYLNDWYWQCIPSNFLKDSVIDIDGSRLTESAGSSTLMIVSALVLVMLAVVSVGFFFFRKMRALPSPELSIPLARV